MKSFEGRMAFGFLGILTIAGLVLATGSVAKSEKGKPRPSGEYRQVNLVSDIAGVGEFTDPNLVNPWGLVVVPSSGRVWVSDNGTGVSTLYDADGTPRSLVVIVAPPAGSTNPATPTGMIGNNTSAFAITEGTNSAPSLFLWSTEDGTVSGWNPVVDPTNAVLVIDHSASNAVYKGIARAADSSSNEFIFVTNFHDGTVEKYDANFNFVSSFTDGTLPAGYAPFGIQDIDGKLYVTFAIQNAEKHDDVAGPGNGFVDVFDLDGNRLQQFAANGALNSPWGVALAPSRFGEFSGAVLVGNFGDGRINAYAPGSGAFLGQLTDVRGNVIAIDSLWGLKFSALSSVPPGLDRHDPDAVDGLVLYFTAGIGGEGHGLFGIIKPVQRGVGHNM
ncbi:MAG TPA: TIGR03118 family protein [Verrucomicrobiae bacterium]|nr:TIGR03118 family protein [Verrucomicrobiae bacterium]